MPQGVRVLAVGSWSEQLGLRTGGRRVALARQQDLYNANANAIRQDQQTGKKINIFEDASRRGGKEEVIRGNPITKQNKRPGAVVLP